MLRGLWALAWLEARIFVREPLGVIATVGVPVVLFIAFGRALGARAGGAARAAGPAAENLLVFAALLVAIGAAVSLTAVIAIYRDGGILKRLRATPLHPVTILGAHVLVKLAFTALTLAILALAGRRLLPLPLEGEILAFALAVLVATASILPIGFVVASVVPTARFAQPITSALLYPLLALSGIFAPVESLPGAWGWIARVQPLTHAVALMRGAWTGADVVALLPSLGALAVAVALGVAISARFFRWE